MHFCGVEGGGGGVVISISDGHIPLMSSNLFPNLAIFSFEVLFYVSLILKVDPRGGYTSELFICWRIRNAKDLSLINSVQVQQLLHFYIREIKKKGRNQESSKRLNSLWIHLHYVDVKYNKPFQKVGKFNWHDCASMRMLTNSNIITNSIIHNHQVNKSESWHWSRQFVAPTILCSSFNFLISQCETCYYTFVWYVCFLVMLFVISPKVVFCIFGWAVPGTPMSSHFVTISRHHLQIYILQIQWC